MSNAGYFGNWASRKCIEEEFRVELDPDVNILLGWYDYEDYDGSAFVLFTQGGKFFEVHGGHCSCSGLEDQWSPEETNLEYLKKQAAEGHLFGYRDSGESVMAAKRYLDMLLEFLADMPEEDAAERLDFVALLSKIKRG